jgi:hypothetical protein
MSHICANDAYRSEVGATNRPENIVIGYVSVVSLSTDFSLVYGFRTNISRVTAHKRIQHLYNVIVLEFLRNICLDFFWINCHSAGANRRICKSRKIGYFGAHFYHHSHRNYKR